MEATAIYTANGFASGGANGVLIWAGEEKFILVGVTDWKIIDLADCEEYLIEGEPEFSGAETHTVTDIEDMKVTITIDQSILPKLEKAIAYFSSYEALPSEDIEGVIIDEILDDDKEAELWAYKRSLVDLKTVAKVRCRALCDEVLGCEPSPASIWSISIDDRKIKNKFVSCDRPVVGRDKDCYYIAVIDWEYTIDIYRV